MLGLECAGEVLEVGADVQGWQVGQRAMALLAGGGYAEQVVVDAGCAMPVPETLSDVEAAAMMETFLTAFLNLFQIGAAGSGNWVLIHGGGSGVGTSALALCRQSHVHVAVTAGSDAKCARCRELGADIAVNYREASFVEAVQQEAGGVDVVLDCIGGAYLDKNLACLRSDGALVVIGLMGGSRAELDMALLLRKRLRIVGSTLRSRNTAFKTELIHEFRRRFGAALEAGRLRPVIHQALPLAEAAAAHRLLEQSAHFGKVVLQVAAGRS